MEFSSEIDNPRHQQLVLPELRSFFQRDHKTFPRYADISHITEPKFNLLYIKKYNVSGGLNPASNPSAKSFQLPSHLLDPPAILQLHYRYTTSLSSVNSMLMTKIEGRLICSVFFHGCYSSSSLQHQTTVLGWSELPEHASLCLHSHA